MDIDNNGVDDKCEAGVKKKIRIGRNVIKRRKKKKKEVYLEEEKELLEMIRSKSQMVCSW